MNNDYLPNVAERRAMLESALGAYKRQGFDYTMQLHVMKAQKYEQEMKLAEMKKLESLRENAYAAIAATKIMLEELPAEETTLQPSKE